MIIDFNAYVGKWPYWPNRYMSEEGLLHLMDRHGVARAVITSTRSVMLDPRAGNDEAAAIAGRHPDRLHWFCSVDPCQDEAALVELERAVGEGAACGLRLAPQHQAWSLNGDPYVGEVVKGAQRLNIPVIIPLRLIMDWRLPMLSIAEVGVFVARYPDCTFVLSGVNYHDLRGALDILRRNANTLIETSCLMGRDNVKWLVETIGAERVLLGLGLPLQSALCGVVKVQCAKMGDREKNLVLGESASLLLDARVGRRAAGGRAGAS